MVLAISLTGLAGECGIYAQNQSFERDGFKSLFNGKDLTGWDANPKFWSVRDGIITGEVKAEEICDEHSYVIWQGGNLKDFELHLKYRFGAGNSGIDYRAMKILKTPNGQRDLKWTLQGYQVDIADNAMGSIYNWWHAENWRQGSPVGQFVLVEEGKPGSKQFNPASYRETLTKAGYYKPGEWNEITIIARGTDLVHRINGYLVSEMIDNINNSRKEGLFGMQIHQSNPKQNSSGQKYEFKDIYLKNFYNQFGQAVLLFNGQDLTGWTAANENSKTAWKISDGVLSASGKAGYLAVPVKYENYILRFNYRPTGSGQAGVMLQLSNPKKPNGILVSGSNGDFNKISSTGKSGLKSQSVTNSGFMKLPADLWYDCEIMVNKGQIEVRVNNIVRAKATGIKSSAGMIGFDVANGNTELRNIVLIPILD